MPAGNGYACHETMVISHMKPGTICLFVIVCLIAWISPPGKARPEQSPSLGKYGIPVHEGARNLKKDVNDDFERAGVSYDLDTAFPAREVIEFYEKAFREMGFITDPQQGYTMRRWEKYDEKTGKWRATDEAPARYVASWVDKQRSVRGLLVLRYGYAEGGKEGLHKLFVDCSLQGLFGPRDLCRFH